MREALRLYLYFFKIGWFTFGGGWSIVAQVRSDYVEKRHEIDDGELLDIVSVGRSLPGTMIGNVAYLFGYHRAGLLGGILAVLGIVTPPLVILSIVTLFYRAFRDSVYVARALMGVRAVVAPIIISAVLKLQDTESELPKPFYYGLMAVGCALSLIFDLSCVILVLGAVAIGVGYYFFMKRKGGAGGDDSP